MKVLFVTPSKSEPKTACSIDFLRAELEQNYADFYSETLDLSQTDLKNVSLNEIKTLSNSTKLKAGDFDLTHTFSFFPFVCRTFFSNLLFYSFEKDKIDGDFQIFLSDINRFNNVKCDVANLTPTKIYAFYQEKINNNKTFDPRPWGWWKVLLLSANYKVKEIFISPRQQLSLQKHQFRRENWLVVEGSGWITLGKDRFYAEKGDFFRIQENEIHRAESAENGMTIVELQLGTYLGEDDLVRIEDKYGRK